MKQRQLGNGLPVSEVGLGCMGMDHAYGRPAPRDEMVRLLRHALELGCNFFDTAVVYGEANEELLGKAFSSIRDQVVLATKFGIVGQKVVNGKPVNLLDSKPASIRRQVEGSLLRLKTDHIDLYYQHRVDPDVEPEIVAETMNALMKEGKILGWGLSNAPVDYKLSFYVQIDLFRLIIFYISIYYLKSFIQRSPRKAPCIPLFSGYYSGYPYKLEF